MSPTIFIHQKFRFFFNSREEQRIHIHVATSDGTAKFWIEPIVSLADFYNISSKDLSLLMTIIEERKHEIINAWNAHFNQ